MNIFSLLKSAFKEWQNDKATVWGAALSYYTVFSLSPLLLLIISLAGLFFGQEAVSGSLFGEIRGLIGDQSAAFLQQALQHTSKSSANIIASLISFGTLLLGASGVFGQLKEALNAIFDVSKKESGGIKGIIFERILTFSMVGVIGFLLLISLVASAIISALNTYLNQLVPFPEILLEVVNFVVSLLITSALFAFLYKLLPDIKIPWKYTFIGGVITSILFTVGKTLLGLYLGNGAVGSTYGAAASLVLILVWVYYAAQIMFYGAEFTQVYARSKGVTLSPKKGAVLVRNAIGNEDDEVLKRKAQQNLDTIIGYVIAGFLAEMAHRLIGKNKKK